MNPPETDAALFRDLLDRARRAEAERDLLVTLVLRDHDNGHRGNARWCQATACRMAADHGRR
ncbi:hypothetical protein GCM10027615_21530 [Plantactinospora veratri]